MESCTMSKRVQSTLRRSNAEGRRKVDSYCLVRCACERKEWRGSENNEDRVSWRLPPSGWGGSLRRRLGKGIGRRKRWSEREAKGQGRKIPATSRLICSSEHLYVSRARIYFSCVRASASTFARIWAFVIPMCFIHRSFAFARRDSSRSANDGGGVKKEKRRLEETTQEPRAFLLFVLFRTMTFSLGCPPTLVGFYRLSFVFLILFCNLGNIDNPTWCRRFLVSQGCFRGWIGGYRYYNRKNLFFIRECYSLKLKFKLDYLSR